MVESARLRRRSLRQTEIVFLQGDPATAVYVVAAGRIRLVRHLADGSSVTMHVARAGETFAEAVLFADFYHCDGIADVGSEVVMIPKPDILRAMAADPAASLGLARLLASQVRDLRSRLELRNVRSASERLLAWMRLNAAGNPPIVRLDRSWTDISADIGLTREAIYRALAALERDGRITRGDGIVGLSVMGGV